MNRRTLLGLTAGLAGSSVLAMADSLPALAQGVDVNAILNDPEAPTGGNPKGDVTIVAYLDYNCPYCKTSAVDLARVVKEDGKIRLVYKDWPILTESSVYGAQLAIAANYQGKYETAHHALMQIPGSRSTGDRMAEAIQASGVDMKKLKADLTTHGTKISALMQRNLAQAESLGINGTPTYLIGPLRASTLDFDGFKEAIAEARRRQAE